VLIMQQKPEHTEYLTTIEAAAYLKLSRQFLEVARHRGDGSGPRFIKLARAVRYRRSALDAWMAAHDHAADKPLRSQPR
jgi:excisionase family DNA binding protein